MPNGQEMMDSLRFEESIKDFSPAEQFLAREVRAVKEECQRRAFCYPTHTPILSKTQIAVGAGGVGFLVALVNLIIEMLKAI